MNTEFLAEGYQRITRASAFLCVMTYRARAPSTSRMIVSFSPTDTSEAGLQNP